MPKTMLGWGLKKKSLPTIQEMDKRADERYFKSLTEKRHEFDVPYDEDEAKYRLSRYQMARALRREGVLKVA